MKPKKKLSLEEWADRHVAMKKQMEREVDRKMRAVMTEVVRKMASK